MSRKKAVAIAKNLYKTIKDYKASDKYIKMGLESFKVGKAVFKMKIG